MLPTAVKNAALARAPPNSIVTSLGMGMQADSSSIRTKMATYPYWATASVMKWVMDSSTGPPGREGSGRGGPRVPADP